MQEDGFDLSQDWMDLGVAAGMGATAGVLMATPGGQGAGAAVAANMAGATMAVSLVGDHLANITTGSDFNCDGHAVTGLVAAASGYAGGMPLAANTAAELIIGRTMIGGTIGFVGGGLRSMAYGDEYTLESAALSTVGSAVGSATSTFTTGTMTALPQHYAAAAVIADQAGWAIPNLFAFFADVSSRRDPRPPRQE